MTGAARISGLILIFLLCAARTAVGQAILEPPFGLQWGDSPQKLIDWAGRHSLDVNLFLPGDQPALRVLKIQPRKGFLPDTRAASVEGRFLGGKLYELTVHYSDPEASSQIMEGRFEELRKQITAEQGKLTNNLQQRTVSDQFATKTQSFHREPVKGLFILLAFTEVEDLLRKKRESKFSLIYRNDNLREEIRQVLASPDR
ncbi:hypothetical protein OVA24_09475 [Luteolibacter sp. SL250]|uniref:hypothetical protein n=1 Tax=Luteolibacter sp. SL250 TaxID=2995170 RepID=UPI00227006EC|nr:hypothetical protein [Luteolibacter sp. SL250]WAC21613.1 hypothetical protein OVA24_09475 [Luteolibacter sp. SL250]